MNKKVKDVEWEQVKYKLDQISKTNILVNGFVCYVSNMGGLSKDDLESLKDRNDLKFLKIDRFKTKSFFHNVISLVLSSYWGVAEVMNLSRIDEILDSMTEQTMAEIYIFNSVHKNEFNQMIWAIENPSKISDFVERFSDYFLYQLDADSDESETGMVDIISYGENCPEVLKDIADLTFFR